VLKISLIVVLLMQDSSQTGLFFSTSIQAHAVTRAGRAEMDWNPRSSYCSEAPPSQLDLFTAFTVDIDGTGMFNSRFYTESSDTSILGCVELHH
jgi:hypothetical protein